MSVGERKTKKDVTLNATFLYQRNSLAKVKILTENFSFCNTYSMSDL